MTDTFAFGYEACRAQLSQRLQEAAPGRVQLLTGPRQVGKTTLLLELMKQLGDVALYAAADGPEALVAGYWEGLWRRVEDTAARRSRAVLLLDEVQHMADWATWLKAQWDALRRRRLPVHIVASGSSALRLGAGARERMAGRFERLTLRHWAAAELSAAFNLDTQAAARAVVTEGAYPGAVPLRSDPARWRAYLRDSIVEPALGRDLLALGVVRRPALLRQVFGAAVSAPAQIVSLQKLQGALQDRGALETIAHYLRLLEEAFLVAALQKHTARPLRSRAAPPKLVVLSNALLAVSDPRGAPNPVAEPARFGAWVENACLAHAWNAGQLVRYWREEPLEVDAVIEGSWGSWAVEVTTGPVRARDLAAVLQFTRRHREFRPLLVAEESELEQARRALVDAVSWEQFLLTGPAAALGR